MIHALPGPEDDEFCVRATAAEVTGDPAARALTCAAVTPGGVGGMVESVAHDPLFEFDLEQVDVARWLDIGQPGTRAVRQQWRATRRGLADTGRAACSDSIQHERSNRYISLPLASAAVARSRSGPVRSCSATRNT